MVYYLPCLIIIGICLAGIIFIIARRFPNLVALDVKSIPGEQQTQIRNEILAQRFIRKAQDVGNKFLPLLYPLGLWFKKAIQHLRQWAAAMERDYKKAKFQEQNGNGLAKEQGIRELLGLADDLMKNEQWAEAEKKYIEVISLAPKSIEAFMGLGELYFQQKEYEQARETLAHILKIDSRYSEAYCRLGLTELKAEYYNRALKYFQQAVDLMPNNPRYLDLLLETSIIGEKKELAKQTLNKLKEVNPDNQKLKEFAERVEKIE